MVLDKEFQLHRKLELHSDQPVGNLARPIERVSDCGGMAGEFFVLTFLFFSPFCFVCSHIILVYPRLGLPFAAYSQDLTKFPGLRGPSDPGSVCKSVVS